MNLDDELCLCFHVTQRKAVNYIRIEKPRHVSQLSECYGAGTGCGWCRPFLKQLFEQQQKSQASLELPTAEDYARLRTQYVKQGKGKPPAGATPIDVV